MPPLLASATTLKRIHREIADLKKEDLGSMTLFPNSDDLFIWKGAIPGPEGSVYEGGVFDIAISLASDYPFTAPKVSFKTRIYHMNISQQGNICIDILKNNWSPALSLFKVMLSLSSLLTDPNPKDPLVPSIATQYMRNRKLHDGTAREWTEKYARPKPNVVPPVPPPALIMPPIQTTLPSSLIATVSPPPRTRGKRPAPTSSTSGSRHSNGEPSSSIRQSSLLPSTGANADTSIIELASDAEEEATSVGSSRSDGHALGKRKRNNVEGPQTESADFGNRHRSKRRPPASVTGSSHVHVQQAQDVIIIDDD